MSNYKTCRYCGGHLDPGERCDCVASMYECLTPENRAKVDQKIEALLEKTKKSRPRVGARRRQERNHTT